MSARRVVVIAVIAVASAAVLSCDSERCERECAAVDRQAQRLFPRGELLPMLELIDEVDARCDCARFTSGDAPPEYSWARAGLQRLDASGRRAEADAFLARAKGPILKELARVRADPTRR